LDGDYTGKVFVFGFGAQSTKMQKLWVKRLDRENLLEEGQSEHDQRIIFGLNK
jgi:hypothetical protein